MLGDPRCRPAPYLARGGWIVLDLSTGRVDWDEVTRWSMIDKALDLGIPEAAETYSSSPHLYSDLDIPTGWPRIITLDDRLEFVEGRYLGDPEAVAAAAAAVAAQAGPVTAN